jgi:hypothetical protein
MFIAALPADGIGAVRQEKTWARGLAGAGSTKDTRLLGRFLIHLDRQSCHDSSLILVG